MNGFLTAVAIFSLMIGGILIFLSYKYTYFFTYKKTNFITGSTILFIISIVSTLHIDGETIYDSAMFSFFTGLAASGFIYVITCINTRFEKEKNLETLLKKIARCDLLAQCIKDSQNKKDKEELKYIIFLFRHEVATAYQMASACKPSFIPVIAVADRFLQKFEAAGQEDCKTTVFDSMDLLHAFFTKNNLSFKEEYNDIPDYKDMKEINKIYISIYNSEKCNVNCRLKAQID
ncbi:hypothetical protein QUW15_10725 [Desulfovibrio piger]|nr:hypothetical protein [Desulfovibrio piger]